MTAPQLEGATPRPWRTGDEPGTRDGVWSTSAITSRGEAPDYEDSYLVAWCHSDYSNEADAALIVAAVNDYDRLKRIEDAARAFSEVASETYQVADKSWPRRYDDARAALRSALAAAAPSRPVEREG